MNKYYKYISDNTDDLTYYNVCNYIANYFNFSMREYSRFIRICKMVFPGKYNQQYSNDGYEKANFYSKTVFIPILIALKMTDLACYHSFSNGKRNDLLIEIFKKDSYGWFRYLLKRNECFENSSECIMVKLSDKLTVFYKAVFNYRKPIQIGSLIFNKDYKDEIIRMANMIISFQI